MKMSTIQKNLNFNNTIKKCEKFQIKICNILNLKTDEIEQYKIYLGFKVEKMKV